MLIQKEFIIILKELKETILELEILNDFVKGYYFVLCLWQYF